MKASQNDALHQRVSSVMTLNPTTHKYENPSPRWFNKDTGEYEVIKPVYFVDPTNPALGMVAPPRVCQEDAVFRQFLLDKEERRRSRVQLEAKKSERAHLTALNRPSAPLLKSHKTKEKLNASAEVFHDELAQKSFREITGTMFSNRGASTFLGPSMAKEEQVRKELERRYRALKPLAPSDAETKSKSPPSETQTIIEAWRNSTPIRAEPKIKKARLTEGERVRTLLRNKSGLRSGYTFVAMQGSYIPPTSIITTSNGRGWEEASGVVIGNRGSQTKEEENVAVNNVRGWRSKQLHAEAW